jgi:hypothetical protein
MTLGDFSSVVQLGVGLHAGTALLQSIAELTATPLSRQLGRLLKISEVKLARDASFQDIHDQACDLAGDLEIKKVQFFNEYREVVAINTAVAGVLALLLGVIAFLFGEEIHPGIGFLITLASFAPAPLSLWFLWSRWTANTVSLKESVNTLHRRMFDPSASTSQ